MYLFLDSSSFIQVGLLNEEFSWVHHDIIRNRKGSHIIHAAIYDALEEHSLKTSQLRGVFLANGPGSYTGIRVAEGVGQVLEIESIPVFSFYHFEVPLFCGVENYRFFAEAFKGEVFQYQFNGEESFELMKEEAFLELSRKGERGFHLEGTILDIELESLYELFKNNSSDIFSKVLERGEHRPPYYFRSAEKEFVPTKK